MAEQTNLPPIQRPKQKSNFWKKAIVIFIIISMSASTVGFAYVSYSNDQQSKKQDSPQNGFQIGNYTFYDVGDGTFGTYVTYQGQQQPIQFRLDPREAGSIPIDDSAVQKILSAKKVYLTSDPQGPELPKVAVAAYEISRIFGFYGIKATGAYTRDADPPNPDIPLKTCADASSTTTVVVLEEGNFTGITEENNCVHVSGFNADELIWAADKLGMNLLGITL